VVTGPLPVFRLSIVGELRPEGARLAWLHPEVRLGLRQSVAFTVSVPEGRADFAWTAGALELCPVRLVLRARVDLRPCASGELGELWARGVAVPSPQLRGRLWLDAGASVGLRWLPTDHLAVTAAAGLVAPLRRDRFELVSEPARGAPTVLSQAPMLGLDADVRVAWRF
jgi:hypothetical protein